LSLIINPDECPRIPAEKHGFLSSDRLEVSVIYSAVTMAFNYGIQPWHLTMAFNYQHPGYAFLNRYGSLQGESDVFHYVEFLRQSAGLIDQVPIDLSLIYQSFKIPTPVRVPLEEQQGILLDSFNGIILIKEDDPVVRQRFTEGHELVELLFDAQDDVAKSLKLPQFDPNRKEKLCDAGAAELLMPRSHFMPQLKQVGVSLETGRSLAKLYQTSLLATLIRMVELATGQHALVVWHVDLKPSQRQAQVEATERPENERPEKKLRIWWRVTSSRWKGGFIPRDKSIGDESAIAQALLTGLPQSGSEQVDLGWGQCFCRVEAMPVQIGDKPCVVSLLHRLPQVLRQL
jgi:Zn-dependent peptidase ImmA (M78 family)